MAIRLKSRTTVTATTTLTLRTAEAAAFVKEALFEAMQEVVGFDTVASAKELCPVLPKATHVRTPGELRDSIDATVRQLKHGVRARIKTSGGYGGYVELGTKYMRREPYLWPAFEANASKIPEAIRERLAEFVDPKKI